MATDQGDHMAQVIEIPAILQCQQGQTTLDAKQQCRLAEETLRVAKRLSTRPRNGKAAGCGSTEAEASQHTKTLIRSPALLTLDRR